MAEDNLIWKKLVVRVFAPTAKPEHYRGTAFLINDKYLLTARHVVEPFRQKFDQNKNQIILKNGPTDGDQYLAEAPIPHTNDEIDIALLRLRMPIGEPINFLSWHENNNLVGEMLEIAGFEDDSLPSSAPSFKALNNNSQYSSVDLQGKDIHGKSGGPVIWNNKLVGILYARTDAPEPQNDKNKTFIYPYSAFKDFLVASGVNLSAQNAAGTRRDLGAQKLIDYKALKPDERAAFIDRDDQWDKHILQRLKSEKNRKSFAFVVAGVDEEWPEALRLRLLIHQNIKNPFEIHRLDLQDGNADQMEHDFLSILVEQIPWLRQDEVEDMDTAELKALFINELILSENPSLFYCYLQSGSSKNFQLLHFITTFWESLDLVAAKKRHFLLIVYGHERRGKGLRALINSGEKKVEDWRQALAGVLSEKQTPKIVAPKLDSPDIDAVLHWSRTVLEGKEQTCFDKAINQQKGKQIPHRTLKDIYNNAIK